VTRWGEHEQFLGILRAPPTRGLSQPLLVIIRARKNRQSPLVTPEEFAAEPGAGHQLQFNFSDRSKLKFL